MYISISILLILITIFLTCWKRLRNLRSDYPEFFNFFLTLVATFVGVFLAIEFTNRAEYKKEEQTAVRLLDAANMDLTNKIFHAEGVINVAKVFWDSTHTIRKHVDNNPMLAPKLFFSLASEEIVLRHISTHGIQKFGLCSDNLSFNLSLIQSEKVENDTILLSWMQTYIDQLKFARKLIVIEELWIEGGIAEENLGHHYQELSMELMGISQEELDKAVDSMDVP